MKPIKFELNYRLDHLSHHASKMIDTLNTDSVGAWISGDGKDDAAAKFTIEGDNKRAIDKLVRSFRDALKELRHIKVWQDGKVVIDNTGSVDVEYESASLTRLTNALSEMSDTQLHHSLSLKSKIHDIEVVIRDLHNKSGMTHDPVKKNNLSDKIKDKQDRLKILKQQLADIH